MQLRLTDRCGAQPARTVYSLTWTDGAKCTARNLIRERVSMEFGALRAPGARGGVGQHLVQYPRHADCTLDEAVALALRGFEIKAFYLIVNGQHITELDESFTLPPHSEVTFLRLLPKLAA